MRRRPAEVQARKDKLPVADADFLQPLETHHRQYLRRGAPIGDDRDADGRVSELIQRMALTVTNE